MRQHELRRRLGVGRVRVSDVEHVRVHYDSNLYLFAPNRGGLWNFGGGEMAVAYLAGQMDYRRPIPPSGLAGYRSTRHAQPFVDRSEGKTGVMLSRSFDYGRTWPEDQRTWIWHNQRSLEEILDWLRPVGRQQREEIDLGDPNAIIHFCPGLYLKFPFGGDTIVAEDPRVEPGRNFHLGRREHPPSLCLRSADRGRTWESRATLIDGPHWLPEAGFQTANLGYVRFDNGVLGIVGSLRTRNIACFYASYDNGVSWDFVSEIARASEASNPRDGYTYLGVHRLPDGRLMCSMHKMPQNQPHVAFSQDDGMSWSPAQAIVSPATYSLPLSGPLPDRAPGDRDGPRYRCPYALVLRNGHILVLFARREYPARGGRGILGVLSTDLGQTWSQEFVIRGDAYSFDLGYPVATELPDGRIFTAYWITTKDGDQPVHENQLVRYIAGTTFRVEGQ